MDSGFRSHLRSAPTFRATPPDGAPQAFDALGEVNSRSNRADIGIISEDAQEMRLPVFPHIAVYPTLRFPHHWFQGL